MKTKERIEEVALDLNPVRSVSGWQHKILIAISFAAGFFHLFTLIIYPLDPWILRGIHLSLASVVIFCFYKPYKNANDRIPIYDFVLTILAVIPTVYIAVNLDDLLSRYGVSPTTWDVVWGLIVIITLLEVTRRTVGMVLPIIAVIFILYGYFGSYMPGGLWHKGYDIPRIVSIMFSGDGIYSTPLGVSATYVIMFIIFGSFLSVSGGTQFFIDLAYALTGRKRGGPAKVSLVSSALMGTVSGSAVGNVVTTGAFTIPLMKRVGYSPRFAASVEAVSSTGGQIMPPVMGAGAFIMADITGIPYFEIALAAIIPAFIYFFTVFWVIDFESGRLGLIPKKDEDIPKVKTVLNQGFHLLIPLFILIFSLLVLGYSPIKAGMYAIISTVVLSWFNKSKEMRLGLKKIFLALAEGFKNTVSIAATCATAGIVIGVFSLTGLGAKLSDMVMVLAYDNVLLALFFTMIVCIILGMGLPTVAAYAIAAATVASSLVNMGIDPLQAHLFILYFASISTITPPVALSAFAGAAIAGAHPIKVGLSTVKIGLAAFVLPYMFIFGSELLMEGEFTHIIWAFITATVGSFVLAASVQGWFGQKLSVIPRLLGLCVALLFIHVGLYSDVIGFLLLIIAAIFHYFKKANIESKETHPS